jgi:uncharacterized protein YjiS (DUF1127 family)
MRDYTLHLSTQYDTANGGLLRRLWSNWNARRSVAALEALDDHLLRDIGVTRAQVEAAVDVPLSENAAVVLDDFARSNRGFVGRSTARHSEYGTISPIRVC